MKKYIKQISHVFALTFVVLGSFGVGFAGVTYNNWAQGAELVAVPYGGQILAELPCPCSGNFWRLIGPPRPGAVIFQPGATVPYMWYMFLTPEEWVLGMYEPVGVCLIPAPHSGCMVIEANGTSLMEGTSLTPGA